MKKRIGIIGNPASLSKGSKDNTGNIIHGHAALHMFADAACIKSDTSESNIDKVRSEFTHVGFVAATNLHVQGAPSYVDQQLHAAKFIEKLDLPVCVFGFGCHAQLNATIANANVDARSVKLLRTLAERSHSVAVRGTFTADLCAKYGVKNVSVVGCQSAYVAAMNNITQPKLTTLGERPCVNFSAATREEYIMYLAITEGAQVIGQANFTETAICNGEISREDFVPRGHKYRLMDAMEKMMRVGAISREDCYDFIMMNFFKFYNVRDWLTHIAKNYDFCIGTRFHGNMAALQAGVPALWIEHDMRVRELCEHFGLPSVSINSLNNFHTLRDFTKVCNYEKFWAKIPRLSREFLDYLTSNGVDEIICPDIHNKLIELTNLKY
jgi:Polysaccharide pyruvyl transferase